MPTRISSCSWRKRSGLYLAVALALTAVSCRQDMHDQPKYIPLRPSDFFADGRSARPLIEGTVARGHLDEDAAFYTGKGPDGKPLNTFPFPVTKDVIERGQQRYNVYCTPCHDRTGNGDGMIVRRGYRKPPSYHTDRLRQMPNGYLYDVITNGFGAMPDYAAQIPPQDRWAIVAYVRALQLSQNATINDVPAEDRAQLFPGRWKVTAQGLDFNVTSELRSELKQWSTRSLIVGIAGAVLTLAGLFIAGPNQFYRSYLWSFLFVLALTLGPLAWLMLQYLTGGAWGVVIRRPCEAAARTIPLVVVMFLPIIVGINNLYEWAHPNLVAASANLKHKAVYLNVPFFLGRAVMYFAGWWFLSWFFNRWSAIEDREGPSRAHRKMAALAGPGIMFWGFTVTFMGVDWVLSIHSEWFSTIYGLLLIAGQGLTSMAFLITLMVLLSYRRPMSEVLTPRHLHDLGKFLLALVMVWAYFSFSQFLIIWAGNLPEEIPWYVTRLNNGWQYVGLLLVVGHFALPFALLLSRDLKRNFKLLSRIAIFVLCMRLVDLYWLVGPEFRKDGFGLSWVDFTAPAGLIGIWLWYFLVQLEKRPLMPLQEPQLEETLEHGRE